WQNTQSHTFDALGHRIASDLHVLNRRGWKSRPDAVEHYAYDGSAVYADLDSGNQVQRRYLRGDQPAQLWAYVGSTGTGPDGSTCSKARVRPTTPSKGAGCKSSSGGAWPAASPTPIATRTTSPPAHPTGSWTSGWRRMPGCWGRRRSTWATRSGMGWSKPGTP